MEFTTKKNPHVYDYAIIGANLKGLVQACTLSKQTSNIVLIDAGETVGGPIRPINTPIGLMNNGLRVFANNESSRKLIGEIEFLTQTSIFQSVKTLPPVTYEGGQIKPFVGFGDFSFDFYEQLSYYFSQEWIQTSLPIYEWPKLLLSHFSGTFLPRSYVTRFLLDSNNHICSVALNGQKVIHANHFIFSSSIKDLPGLMPVEALSGKLRQKIAKTTFWTAVCLDVLHEHVVTNLQNIHILNGTTQDEIGPCAGQFLPPVTTPDGQKQYSQWATFMKDDEAEDSELVGAALKKIKRQIKRAYPQSLEAQSFERVVVWPADPQVIMPEFNVKNFYSPDELTAPGPIS